MAKSSTYTSACRAKLWICRIVDFLVLIAPVLVYFFIGLGSGALVYQKVALVGMFAIALILTLFNMVWQKKLRCPIWICLIGLFIAIQQWLLPLVVILAISSIVDEFLLTPLIKYYKTKLIANKAMDERLQ